MTSTLCKYRARFTAYRRTVQHVRSHCATLKQAYRVLALTGWPVVRRRPWAITWRWGTHDSSTVTICTCYTSLIEPRATITAWHGPFHIFVGQCVPANDDVDEGDE